MTEFEIVCERCGKPAKIKAEDGKLCIDCWREVRREKREKRIQDSLDYCFSYNNQRKLTPSEEELLNEIMEELNPKGL